MHIESKPLSLLIFFDLHDTGQNYECIDQQVYASLQNVP